MQPLSNHTALVTGASRGMGKGITLALAEAGATVVGSKIQCSSKVKHPLAES